MNKDTVTELSNKKNLALLEDSLFPEVYLEVFPPPKEGELEPKPVPQLLS